MQGLFTGPKSQGVRLKCGTLVLHSGQKSRLHFDRERSSLYQFANMFHSVMLHKSNFKILSEEYEI
jgi:hypothetical protein